LFSRQEIPLGGDVPWALCLSRSHFSVSIEGRPLVAPVTQRYRFSPCCALTSAIGWQNYPAGGGEPGIGLFSTRATGGLASGEANWVCDI
jgi:hypothetical protein